MSELKCPICGGEMIGNIGSPICHYNQDCPIHDRSIPQEIYDLLDRTRKALEFITRISGAGMSYQDMFIDAHEVAKFALGQIKYPVLIGRYDKEMTDLLRGGDNE